MAGNNYSLLLIQPLIILVCEDSKLEIIYRCRMDSGGRFCVCIENIFATDQDEENKETVAVSELAIQLWGLL